MIQQEQFVCQMHQQNPITHMCIQKQCKESYRWLCRMCQQQKFHNNNGTTPCRIISLKELKESFKNLINKQYQDFFRCNQKDQAVFLNLLEIKKLLDNIINIYFEKMKFQENLSQSIRLFNNNIEEISMNQLNLLLSLKDYNINYEAIEDQILNIIENLNQLEIIDFKEHSVRQYGCAESTAQISPNENQLAFFQFSLTDDDDEDLYEGNIQTVNIKTNRCLYRNFQDQIVKQILYSTNSQFLLALDVLGQIKCFETKNKFKQLFELKLNTQEVGQILFKNSQQIIIDVRQTIIIYDVTKRYVKDLEVHDNWCCLDYDHRKKQIITASQKGNFHFRDQNGKLIQKINISQKLQSIKKTNNDNNIMLQNDKQTNLQLYQIDYEAQRMILLQTYFMGIGVSRFQFFSICDDQRIIIIYLLENKYLDRIQILSKNLKTIQEIIFDWKEFEFLCLSNSLKYILIQNDDALNILQKSYS